MLGSSGFLIPETSISDGSLRVVFKIYLVLVGTIVAFAGGQAIQYFVRNRLLGHKPVPLSTTTGWIQGTSLGKAIITMRSLPGSYFGLFMILVTALDIVGELAVAKAITKVSAHARGVSDQGLIVPSNGQYSVAPDVYNGAYLSASLMQTTNYANSLLFNSSLPPYAIYRFIPYPIDTNFLAEEQDVIGEWKCLKTTSEPIFYNYTRSTFNTSTTVFPAVISHDLMNRGLLFNVSYGNGHPTYSYTVGTLFNNGTSNFNSEAPANHLIVLTTNATGVGSVFDVKVGVNVENFVDDRNALTGSLKMDTFACSLQAAGKDQTVYDVARAINSTFTMGSILNTVSGAMYPDLLSIRSWKSDTIITNLQYILNSIIMVSGSGQSTLSENTEGYSYGAVIQATILPYWVLVVCVIYALAMLGVVTMSLYFWAQNKKVASSYDNSKESVVSSADVNEHAPVGLQGWAKYATYQAGNGKLNFKDFKPSQYFLDANSRSREVIDIVPRHGHAASETSTIYNGAHGDGHVRQNSTMKENGALLSERV